MTFAAHCTNELTPTSDDLQGLKVKRETHQSSHQSALEDCGEIDADVLSSDTRAMETA